MNTPDFDQLCDAFTQLNIVETSPAELQGLACGIFSAGFSPSAEQWLETVANYVDQPTIAGDSSLILELADSCQQQLSEGGFDLQLCLPDDDLYGIVERSDALAHWCQGFLHGFGAVQAELSQDSQELLHDLTEISRLSVDEEPTGEMLEDSEGDYMELVEYIRVAAMNLFLDYSRTAEDESRH